MKKVKYIAAMLALVGTVGSVQANSEVNNEVNSQTIKHEIQFMNDSELNEVVGAKFQGFSRTDVERWLNIAIEAGGGIYHLTRIELNTVKSRIRLLEGHKKSYNKRDVTNWIFDEIDNYYVGVGHPDQLGILRKIHHYNKTAALNGRLF